MSDKGGGGKRAKSSGRKTGPGGAGASEPVAAPEPAPVAPKVEAPAPKAPAPKVEAPKSSASDAVARLRDIQGRALSMEPSHITAEVNKLASLPTKELKAVEKEFLGVSIGGSKSKMIASIQAKIDGSRASQEHVQGIRNY